MTLLGSLIDFDEDTRHAESLQDRLPKEVIEIGERAFNVTFEPSFKFLGRVNSWCGKLSSVAFLVTIFLTIAWTVKGLYTSDFLKDVNLFFGLFVLLFFGFFWLFLVVFVAYMGVMISISIIRKVTWGASKRLSYMRFLEESLPLFEVDSKT